MYDDGIAPGARIAPVASDAWIAPDGGFHYVPKYSHCTVARIALGDDTGGRMLEDRGWIHLSFADPMMGNGHKPTQAQIDTLADTLVAYRSAGHVLAEELDHAIAFILRAL